MGAWVSNCRVTIFIRVKSLCLNNVHQLNNWFIHWQMESTCRRLWWVQPQDHLVGPPQIKSYAEKYWNYHPVSLCIVQKTHKTGTNISRSLFPEKTVQLLFFYRFLNPCPFTPRESDKTWLKSKFREWRVVHWKFKHIASLHIFFWLLHFDSKARRHKQQYYSLQSLTFLSTVTRHVLLLAAAKRLFVTVFFFLDTAHLSRDSVFVCSLNIEGVIMKIGRVTNNFFKRKLKGVFSVITN